MENRWWQRTWEELVLVDAGEKGNTDLRWFGSLRQCVGGVEEEARDPFLGVRDSSGEACGFGTNVSS